MACAANIWERLFDAARGLKTIEIFMESGLIGSAFAVWPFILGSFGKRVVDSLFEGPTGERP